MSERIPWKLDDKRTWASRPFPDGRPGPRLTVPDVHEVFRQFTLGVRAVRHIALLANLDADRVDVALKLLRKAGVIEYDRDARRWRVCEVPNGSSEDVGSQPHEEHS
jgi:hypothetical protein